MVLMLVGCETTQEVRVLEAHGCEVLTLTFEADSVIMTKPGKY